MTPIEVTVSAADEPTGWRVARGWDIGIPGLVITEGRTTLGDTCWGPTHQASGHSITGLYLSPEAAYAYALELAGCDWTRCAYALRRDPYVRQVVRAATLTYPPDVRCGGGQVPDQQLKVGP